MPEIGTFGLMSGDGKRSAGHRIQATAPILDSTDPVARGQEIDKYPVGCEQHANRLSDF